MDTWTSLLSAAVFMHVCVCAHSTSDSFPRAQNLTWRSTNFKTVLTWEPQPSEHYSYTVEFSQVGRDRQKNPHCFRSSKTQCDLSSSLTDLSVCYTADVLSEPPLGVASELTEFPHASSPRFCPMEDTDILRPEFKLHVSEDKKKTTLYVSDPLTAVFKDGRQLTIRDVFGERLEYRVTYRRNQSTGKKVLNSKNSEVDLPDLDPGDSYCFQVQAFIRSRRTDKQLGELSRTLCSHDDDPSILEVYSVGVIAGAIFIILLLIGIVIAVTVICCKRRKKSLKKEKEGVPLNTV